MSPRLTRLAVLAAMLLPLLGCNTKIVVCPVPAILADTASVTVFRPGTTPDLANELYTVSLINAVGDCTYSKTQGTVRAALDLTFRATRVPTADGASYAVPFFVVVQEGNKIYSKKLYTLRFSFAPGAATALVTQSPDDTTIKISNGKLPWVYQLLSGFQMTQAQIDYNKKKGRYLP